MEAAAATVDVGARARELEATLPGGRTGGGLIAVASLALASLVAAILLTASGGGDHPVGRIALHALVVGVPVGTGLYAMRTAATRRFGVLLAGAGLLWSVAVLAEAPSSLAYSTGRVAAWLIFPSVYYLMLAFPEGRLTLRRDRYLFWAIALLIAGPFIGSALVSATYPPSSPWATCNLDCPANAFMVLSSEPAWVHDVLGPLRDALSVLVLTGVCLSFGLRSRASSLTRQAATSPVLLVSIASTVVLVAFIVARRADPGSDVASSLGWAWALCLPAIGAAFLLGLVQRRLLMSHLLSGMTVGLRGSPEPAEVVAMVRCTVGVAASRLLTWDGRAEHWVDDDGEVVDAHALLAEGHAFRVVSDAEGPVAAIVLDDGLDPDDELIDAIVTLAETGLRGAHLKQELELSLHDLDDSRKRIATAADVERRRIERDLHDGAQQRLIALRMRLSLAEDLLAEDPRTASEAIHDLGRDVDLALEEIRSLAHGIYPAVLADRGLADALRSVARRAPFPVTVHAAGLTRHSSEIESAVYFSCLEALQNVVKHGGDDVRARITLRQNSALHFDVTDNGPGFDGASTVRGIGLRNMRDRVESLGGQLVVESASGRGTTVRGIVPLPHGALRPAPA